MRKRFLVTDGKETFISTQVAATAAQVGKHLPSVSGAALQSKASKGTSLLKRKARKYSYGAVISHIVIASLIIGMVVLGYQPPVNGANATVNSVSDLSTYPDQAPSLDQVTSANMAAVAAQTANVIVKEDVQSYATSVNILSQTAQTDTSVVNKPQILTASSGAHGVHTYTTVAGDTVPSVAAANGLNANTLRWANNLTSDALTPGTTLKIPSINGVVHTVQSGETPQSLATKYQSDASRITTYNDAELSGLQVGQQIIIPDGTPPANELPGYHAYTRSNTYVRSFVSYGYGGGYPYGQCTWWAYTRRAQLGRPVGSNWGNAYTWAIAAARDGYRVDRTPEVGAVMQTTAGYFGHVAVVERINPDGSVFISEYNYLGSGYHTRTLSAGEASGYNYIH